MADRERRGAPPYGAEFQARTVVMDSDDIGRAIRRMAHEIVERNHGLDHLLLGDGDARRAAVDDAADGRTVALAPGGDAEKMTESVV